MGLSRERRAFLVGVLGEYRTKALEEALAKKERELMEAGISFKQVDEAGRPYGGATSWEQLDVYERAEETADVGRVFNIIVGNIMADGAMTPEARAAAVRQAVDDMESRIADVGKKEAPGGKPLGLLGSGGGVKPFLDMLKPPKPTPETEALAKQYEESDHPGGALTADLVRGKVLR